MKVVEQCSTDETFNEIVLDTIDRCIMYFSTNTEVKSPGGFILKAIQFDYYKEDREEQKKKEEHDTKQQYEQKLRKEIAALATAGKQEFEERRGPQIKQLRAQYLTEAVAKDAIQAYAT